MSALLTFVVAGSPRLGRGDCDYLYGPEQPELCGSAGAYWYPAMGGGIAVLCEAHGARHFPVGAQRIDDRVWHGGGAVVPSEEARRDA